MELLGFFLTILQMVFFCQLAFPVLTWVLKGETLAMGYNNTDVKSNGYVRIMASQATALFLCGKYNFLICKLRSVKLSDSLSISWHPSPLCSRFYCWFCSFWGSLGVLFFCSKSNLVTQHTEMCWVCNRSVLECHKKEWKRWKLSRPKCFESSSTDKKRVVSIPSTLVEMHYILLPRQFVILVHGFSALLGFVITFK